MVCLIAPCLTAAAAAAATAATCGGLTARVFTAGASSLKPLFPMRFPKEPGNGVVLPPEVLPALTCRIALRLARGRTAELCRTTVEELWGACKEFIAGVGLPPLVMLVLALVALWLPAVTIPSRPRCTSQFISGDETGTNRQPFMVEKGCGVAPLEGVRMPDIEPVLEADCTAENLAPYCVNGIVETDLADKLPPVCDTIAGTVT